MEDCVISEEVLDKETEKEKEKEKELNELEGNSEIMDKDEKINEDDITPKEGMAFNSLDEVHVFYKKYAQHIGFGTKIRSTRRENGVVSQCVIACAREGKCDLRKNCSYKKKMTAKIECKAQIYARLYADGVWILQKVNLEHNHLVSPSKARFFRSNKILNERVKKQLELNDKVGIPVCKSFLSFATQAGGVEKLSFGEKDARNYIEKARRLRLGVGDANAILEYFTRMQKQNSNFFHSMDMDDEGRLRHVFWVDVRSRASYRYFNDVITFDTTYLTNKYDMPFAPFVGINHHGQSILLGCGLLSNESVESYVWLFTIWLACMSGQPPNAIITDQCKSIQGAVSRVFPKSQHRLCLWHIMKKIPEKLGGFKERETIIWRLKQAVYDSLRVEEFEQSWGQMIEDFDLHDNEWLQSLYKIREKWIPVFVKDTFWAGMSTTQRSESMNAFFDTYINSKTSLKQFVSQYEVALGRKYENEAIADFNSFYKERELISSSSIEEQLRTLYTSNIFSKFQEEVKNVVNCINTTLISKNGHAFVYEVTERVKIDGMKESILKKFEVCFNPEKVEVTCICRSFEFRGILCNHAISVLDSNHVTKLPSQYIVQRWRKDFKRLHSLERNARKVTGFACAQMDRFDDICMHCHEFAEIGSSSDGKYKYALNLMSKAIKELLDWNEGKQDHQIVGAVGHEEININRVSDPVHVKRKGRPRELRLKSTIEKVVNAKTKKTRHNPTKILRCEKRSNNNHRDITLEQESIQNGQHDNPIIGTQESVHIPLSQVECFQSIGSEVRTQPCFGHAPYSFQPMAYQGNQTFQQLMFQELMRNLESHGNADLQSGPSEGNQHL